MPSKSHSHSINRLLVLCMGGSLRVGVLLRMVGSRCIACPGARPGAPGCCPSYLVKCLNIALYLPK